MPHRLHSLLPALAGRAATSAAKAGGLAALASAAGWIAYSRLAIDRRMRLPPALPGRHERLHTSEGAVGLYGSPEGDGAPLLLIHSVNAAASAYEVRPLYLHYRGRRPVYALDLPGFGFSDRERRIYTPRVMVEAIHAAAAEIAARHGRPVDAVALSLSAAFLARAALERAQDYRSLFLVSPTGFDARLSGHGPAEGDRGSELRRNAFAFPLWGRAAFDALVSRPSMRFFLEKTWGGPQIDEGLLEYGYASAHQPGAEHAPFSFLSGYLFPTDTSRLYEALWLPVFVVHGARGDFVDFREAPRFARRPNWRVI